MNIQENKNSPRPLIYISGGLTGRPPAEYSAHFQQAATSLEAQGYDVINPLHNGLPADAAWHEHMRADIRLLTLCDEIYMLAGWERSTGASAEHALAKALGLTFSYEVPPKHPEIKHAILTALGVTFREMSRRSRKRAIVYARFIYSHHANEAGDSAVTIASELGCKHSDVSYYLRKYDPEYRYNREFRNAARAVADLLKLYKQ